MYLYNPIEDCYATKKKIKIFRKELDLLREKKKKLRILDFGCGNALDCGKYLFNNLDEYLGYDIYKPGIEFAKKKFKKKNVNFTNIFPKRKFDVIICSEVFEHLENPTEIIKKLNISIHTGGILLGSVPNGFGLTEIEKFLIHKLGIYIFIKKIYYFFRKNKKIKKKNPFNYESGHIQFFRINVLKKIFKKASFKVDFIKNGSFMGADISGEIIFRSEIMKKINTTIPDYLPSFMCATWIFKLLKNE